MRLAADACCWSNRRGFGRFTRELLGAMAARLAQEHRLHLVVDRHTAADADFPPEVDVVEVATGVAPTAAAAADSSRSIPDMWRITRAIGRLDPDVVFFPAVYTWVPVPRQVPAVVTFHDAIAETHPGLIFNGLLPRLAWAAKVRHALRRADALVTVSESARAQMVERLGVDPGRVTVTTEGPPAGFGPVEKRSRLAAVRARYRLPPDAALILHVGGLSPHKNLGRLVEAMARLDDAESCLVLAGDPGDGFLGCVDDLRRQVAETGLGERVFFPGFIAEDDLPTLYSTATVVALPSLMEGFGLPAVEAMTCGVPVAASRGGSLPEILGDAGLAFDAEDVDAMASALDRLLADETLRRELAQRGLERARRYSWESSADTVLELLLTTARGAAP